MISAAVKDLKTDKYLHAYKPEVDGQHAHAQRSASSSS